MNKKIFIVAVLVTITLTGCTFNTNNTNDLTEISRTVEIEDKEQLLNEVKQFITTEKTDEFKYISSELSINNSDVLDTIQDDCEYYLFKGSFYLQTDNYMYRFQFNKDNIIESYIKYNLEA